MIEVHIELNPHLGSMTPNKINHSNFTALLGLLQEFLISRGPQVLTRGSCDLNSRLEEEGNF